MRRFAWLLLLAIPITSCHSVTGRLWSYATAGPKRVGTAWLAIEFAYWHEPTNGPAFRYRVATEDDSLAPHLPEAGWIVLHDRGHGDALWNRLRAGDQIEIALVRRQLGTRARWRAWTRGEISYWNASLHCRAPGRLTDLPAGGFVSRIEVEHFLRGPRLPMVLEALVLTPPVLVGESAVFLVRQLSRVDWKAVGTSVGKAVGEALAELIVKAILNLINPFAWLGLTGDDDDEDDVDHRINRNPAPRKSGPRRARARR